MPVVYIREDTPLPERAPNDFYETDRGTVTTALAYLRHRLPRLPDLALDVGAGRGPWGCGYKYFESQSILDGVEQDANLTCPCWYDHWFNDDFLTWDESCEGEYHLVFGNPPYNRAEAFVRKALAMVPVGGHVYFLMKLAFLAGQRRRDGLYREHPLRECLVLSKRPSFQANGHTAPDEYAMFWWTKGWIGPTTVSQL